MNLFGFLKPLRRIQVINREETKLTLADWRGDKALVSLAMRVWANPDFRLMVACLRNENPSNSVLPDDAAPHRSIALQRRAEGYLMAVANLEAMAIVENKVEFPEPTFESEEQPPEMIKA